MSKSKPRIKFWNGNYWCSGNGLTSCAATAPESYDRWVVFCQAMDGKEVMPPVVLAKTGDELAIEEIGKMDSLQLLEFMSKNPEYLVDSYFVEFGLAIIDRIKVLDGESNAV